MKIFSFYQCYIISSYQKSPNIYFCSNSLFRFTKSSVQFFLPTLILVTDPEEEAIPSCHYDQGKDEAGRDC